MRRTIPERAFSDRIGRRKSKPRDWVCDTTSDDPRRDTSPQITAFAPLWRISKRSVKCWMWLLFLLEWLPSRVFGIVPAKAFSLKVLGHNLQQRQQKASLLWLWLSLREGEYREREAARTSQPQTSPPSTTKVVIVGAGISGLSVAYHLRKFCSEQHALRPHRDPSPRFDIEILEGRGAIGGRIRPFRIDGGGDASDPGSEGSATSSSPSSTTTKQKKDEHHPTWIDLGAQWVHEATPQNPIRRLLEDDLDLGFVGDGLPRYHSKRGVRTNVLFDRDGTPMDEGAVRRARTVFYKARTDAETNDTHPATVSLRDLLDARIGIELGSDQRLGTSPRVSTTGATAANTTANRTESEATQPTVSAKRSCFDRAMNYFVDRTEGHEGGQFHEISANLVDRLYEGSGSGPDRVVAGSYKSLLDELSSRLGFDGNYDDVPEDKDAVVDGGPDETFELKKQTKGDQTNHCRVRLRCNARVERIEYGNEISDGNERISVTIVENETTSAGNQLGQRGSDISYHYPSALKAAAAATTRTTITPKTSVVESDYCVCTVPLGVLQHRAIEFVPPLPDARQEAIDGIGMGLLNKIVFRFDFNETTTTQTSDETTNSTNESGGSDGYKFWGNLKQFGICHEDPSRIKSYFDCTEDYYPAAADRENRRNGTTRSAILVQFLSGAAADRVDPPRIRTAAASTPTPETGLTDAEVVTESLAALRSVFGTDKVPKPSVAKVTRWREDPWSRGSYSFPKTGSTAGMYDEIAAPLGGNSGDRDSNSDGRLLFAGEHTSKELQASVHGAWDSGAREARRIWNGIVETEC